MPRQLPWLDKGATSTKAQLRRASQATRPGPSKADMDDDFFAGTPLEISRTENEPSYSRDEPVAKVFGSSYRGRMKERPEPNVRVPSSSPPTMPDLPPPEIEYMKRATDKFYLRDDEWMMVEDEFLHTAKLFTRHLHLAEYERMREDMKLKKTIPRPIVDGTKPSQQRMFQMKAQKQTQIQRKAMIDVLSSGTEDIDDDVGSSRKLARKKNLPPSRTPLKGHKSPSQDAKTRSNNDVLDIPTQELKEKRHYFSKPALSARQALTTRPSRKSVFDFLDETPPSLTLGGSSIRNKSGISTSNKPSSPVKSDNTSTIHSTSFIKPPIASQDSHSQFYNKISGRPGKSMDKQSERSTHETPISPTEQRIAKRKAEKRQGSQKRKSIKLDEIPTFLV